MGSKVQCLDCVESWKRNRAVYGQKEKNLGYVSFLFTRMISSNQYLLYDFEDTGRSVIRNEINLSQKHCFIMFFAFITNS